MASPPLLRLCIEEVTKPLPLPAWAAKIEVAGRIVATPPSTPPHPKLQHEVVPPWGMEADTVPVRPATGRLGIPRQGGTLAFLEETASKALKAKSTAEACQSVSLRRGDTEERAGAMARHEVVPPWAVEENSSRPATGEELRMLSSEALKRRKMKDVVPVNPETMLPAGQASGKASRQNEVPSSVPETETPRPKKSKGDIRWTPFVQKIVALTSARDRTSAAEQEAEKAKVKLKDKNQEIAPCVATTKAQREYGIKDGDPGGLSTERQRRWQNPPREEEIQREVQAALDAQRERTRYERNFEKEEDKYFAAKAAAHALQLEIREAEARATWRAKCEDVQKEVLQQRKELRAGKIQSKQMAEGANSFQIGRDMLSELDALRQSKLKNAMLRAEDLEARRQRKQKEDAHLDLDLDLLIISCGIRPRDELARACDLQMGERGGVMVDGCMRSSDPNIYAVGEVASYEGGMVYGLWKPGMEQAEVLAATLGSPSAGLRYHGSDLSTKLKLLGVNVASFGESAAFWHGKTYQLLRDDEKPSMCVRSVLDLSSGTYRKLIFKRMPGGCRKLLGGILINSLDDYPSLCDIARCGKELWGLEPMVLVEGPRVTPGRLEQSFPQARL